MLNFIFVALCTWITTFLPYKDVCVPSANDEFVEVVQRKNAITAFGYTITTPYELLSNSVFFDNFYSNLYDLNTQGQTYTLAPYYYDNVYFVAWDNTDLNNPDTAVNNHGVLLNNITFTYQQVSVIGSHYAKKYDVHFAFADDSYFNYSIFCTYDVSASYGVQFIGSTYVDLVNFSGNSVYYLYLRSNSFLYTNVFNRSDDYDNGYNQGYQQGYDSGYDYGYSSGLDYGENHPTQTLVDEIYDRGYAYGYSEGLNSDDVLSTIFTGILDVSFIPVNVFLQMFNYEIMGVNIAGLVSGLLTVALLLILMRFITGRRV